jgi:hypothetical protein
VTGTNHEGVRLPRQIDVVAVAAGADQQPRIFLAANGRPNSILHRHAHLALTPSMLDYPETAMDHNPAEISRTSDVPRRRVARETLTA